MSIVDRARPEIRALKPYSSARMEAAVGATRGVALLNANENPWPARAHVGAALNRYPDPQPAELVAVMATFYGVKPEQVLVTRGSDEGIDLLVRAFCRPGKDAVLQCPPCFGMYQIAAATQAAKIVDVPLRRPHFDLDPDAIVEAIDFYTKIIFLTSPNSPTGNSIAREVMLDLIDLTANKTIVAVDEAYIEFAPQRSVAELIDECENLVVFRTLSKAFALAGARCGAVLASAPVIELLRRIIPPYPLPTPSIKAALGVFDSAGLQDTGNKIRRLVTMRDSMAKVLAQLRCVEQVWPSDANFLLVRFADASQIMQAAAAGGMILRDLGNKPGLKNCLRITIGTEDQNTRLLELLRTLP